MGNSLYSPSSKWTKRKKNSSEQKLWKNRVFSCDLNTRKDCDSHRETGVLPKPSSSDSKAYVPDSFERSRICFTVSSHQYCGSISFQFQTWRRGFLLMMYMQLPPCKCCYSQISLCFMVDWIGHWKWIILPIQTTFCFKSVTFLTSRHNSFTNLHKNIENE